MPLMNCPACSSKVSSDALSCPQCGHPIAQERIRRTRVFAIRKVVVHAVVLALLFSVAGYMHHASAQKPKYSQKEYDHCIKYEKDNDYRRRYDKIYPSKASKARRARSASFLGGNSGARRTPQYYCQHIKIRMRHDRSTLGRYKHGAFGALGVATAYIVFVLIRLMMMPRGKKAG